MFYDYLNDYFNFILYYYEVKSDFVVIVFVIVHQIDRTVIDFETHSFLRRIFFHSFVALLSLMVIWMN